MVKRKDETKVEEMTPEEERAYWDAQDPLRQGKKVRVQRPQPPEDRLSYFALRLSGRDIARLARLAQEKGMKPSELARALILQGLEQAVERQDLDRRVGLLEQEVGDLRKYTIAPARLRQLHVKGANMNLQSFLRRVSDVEKTANPQAVRAFWDARERLGNYLAGPLAPPLLNAAVVPFLKLWNSYRLPINWIRLADVWTPEMQQTAQGLSAQRLEDVDDTLLQGVVNLYARLRQVRGIGPTNASKLLALSLPELCVMWDKAIRERYQTPRAPLRGRGVRQLEPSDYYDFLQRSRSEANELIQQCMEDMKTSRSAAVAWLRQLPLRVSKSVYPREKPLAYLLDEFHYNRTRTWT